MFVDSSHNFQCKIGKDPYLFFNSKLKLSVYESKKIYVLYQAVLLVTPIKLLKELWSICSSWRIHKVILSIIRAVVLSNSHLHTIRQLPTNLLHCKVPRRIQTWLRIETNNVFFKVNMFYTYFLQIIIQALFVC